MHKINVHLEMNILIFPSLCVVSGEMYLTNRASKLLRRRLLAASGFAVAIIELRTTVTCNKVHAGELCTVEVRVKSLRYNNE